MNLKSLKLNALAYANQHENEKIPFGSSYYQMVTGTANGNPLRTPSAFRQTHKSAADTDAYNQLPDLLGATITIQIDPTEDPSRSMITRRLLTALGLHAKHETCHFFDFIEAGNLIFMQHRMPNKVQAGVMFSQPCIQTMLDDVQEDATVLLPLRSTWVVTEIGEQHIDVVDPKDPSRTAALPAGIVFACDTPDVDGDFDTYSIAVQICNHEGADPMPVEVFQNASRVRLEMSDKVAEYAATCVLECAHNEPRGGVLREGDVVKFGESVLDRLIIATLRDTPADTVLGTCGEHNVDGRIGLMARLSANRPMLPEFAEAIGKARRTVFDRPTTEDTNDRQWTVVRHEYQDEAISRDELSDEDVQLRHCNLVLEHRPTGDIMRLPAGVATMKTTQVNGMSLDELIESEGRLPAPETERDPFQELLAQILGGRG